jgi:hypothetical protein
VRTFEVIGDDPQASGFAAERTDQVRGLLGESSLG